MINRRPFESLYVHVPFCHGKCSYCAFYSEGHHGRETRLDYLHGILKSMEGQAANCIPLRSVFIGGGTPTALDDDLFQRLLKGIHDCFPLADDVEWTVEANPESLTKEKIEIMGRVGITRVSMGIQSFNPRIRNILGRQGNLDELEEKVKYLKNTAIHHLNFDFIYNVPAQKPEDFEMDLKQALKFDVDHVSAYALTIEEGTPLAAYGMAVTDDEFLDFWNLADSTLSQAGFSRYEISNFAKNDCKCRHNDEIWHGGTYLGIGPAATSFDGLDRWTQVANLSQWMAGESAEQDILPPLVRAAEILAFGMRTVAGWKWEDFFARTGVDAKALRGKSLERLEKLGLVVMDGFGVRPTGNGLLFNDEVVMELL